MINEQGAQNTVEQADELLKKIKADEQRFSAEADGLISEIKQGIEEFNKTDKELEAVDQAANVDIETAVLEFLSSQDVAEQKKKS